MNLYKVFNEKERKRFEKVESIQDRDYTKEDIIRLENELAESVVNNSKKTNIQESREYYNLIDKLESCISNYELTKEQNNI